MSFSARDLAASSSRSPSFALRPLQRIASAARYDPKLACLDLIESRGSCTLDQLVKVLQLPRKHVFDHLSYLLASSYLARTSAGVYYLVPQNDAQGVLNCLRGRRATLLEIALECNFERSDRLGPDLDAAKAVLDWLIFLNKVQLKEGEFFLVFQDGDGPAGSENDLLSSQPFYLEEEAEAEAKADTPYRQ
ncbi:hypothetical protein [Gloeobacter kilaueensis]|uniref:Uncharacterized protein n=1 Tax=Gloeobacter kilaueensis (strain ATCC BAA-2537 / CCAP 1431/1 / ULC 316 / JS1) TaxID=1183438 RepID=U5QC21_GLOK1|nr:hypothetical protein [Gloeobacter kilaueensis]AGY56391.1 hypothetical protein GKIL_0144 [Gloeobacter kilaueensis JS1]